MVNPATWDDLSTTDWDSLWTWDDPMANAAMNAAFGTGAITRSGAQLLMNWGGGVVTDGLDSAHARDLFVNPATAEVNRVVNSTFEAGVANWTPTGATATQSSVYHHGGSFSLLMTPNGVAVTPVVLSDFMAIQPGAWYYLDGWIMSPTGYTVSLNVNWYTAGSVFISAGSTTSAPLLGVGQRRTGYFKAPATATQAKIEVSETGTPAAGNLVYLDDVLLTGINPSVSLGWGKLDSGETWQLTAPTLSWLDGVSAWMAVSALATPVYAYVSPTEFSSIDFDVVTKVMTRELITGPGAGAVFLLGRITDTNNHVRGRIDVNTDQTFNWLLETVVGGVTALVGSGPIQGFKHAVSTYVWVRTQGIGSRLQIKVWPDGVMEPDEWSGVGTDTAWPTTPGGVGLGAFLYAGTTNALPVPFRFGRFFVGENAAFPANTVSLSSSMDDGLPTEATNTQNVGIAEMTASLAGPQGQVPARYYSTFRTDQPWSDFPRDVAAVIVNSGAVAADGVRDTRLFTGQMADIPTEGRDARIKAVSHGRVRLSTAVQPPSVHGYYEGREATWLASYALFKSGVYVAPPVNPGCRLYVPLHGNSHPFIPDTNSFDGFNFGSVFHDAVVVGGGIGLYMTPEFVDGPFVAGMEAHSNSTSIRRFFWRSDKPLSFGPGADFFAKVDNAGRIEFWIRGDPADMVGSLEPGNTELLTVYFANPGVTRWFLLKINLDRQIIFGMKDGVNTRTLTGRTVPVDGKWHFVGVSWDIGGSKIDLNFDGAVDTYSAAPLSNANLEVGDDIKASIIQSFLPISEFRMSSGTWSAPRGIWANAVPWTQGAVIRRSLLTFDSIAEPQPREAYEMLTALARGELARTGFDDFDRFLYLTAPYWTEADQQRVIETLSTDTNLGADFKPFQDINKTYNQVTLTYKQTKTEERFLTCYESSQLIQIPPRGSVVIEASLTTTVIEVRGSTIAVMDGAAVAALTGPEAINYITANFSQDGSGSYALPGDLVATVVAWTPGSATILLQSFTVGYLFVANNVSLPSLVLSGKSLVKTDSSITKQDDANIAVKGTRALNTALPMVQSAADAGMIAQELVARLRNPRTNWISSAWGDARRKPGQLVVANDVDNTQVTGTFRLTGVTNHQQDENLEQKLTAEVALPVMVWGQGVWGESLWGGG